MRHVSLAISILAVAVALVTVLGHRAHTEAVLLQNRASDVWSEYQARRIRQTQVQVASDLLQLQASGAPSAAQARLLEQYKQRDEHWAEETKEGQLEAQKLEAEVALVERHASRYDLGEALLQIAVVLASITLLTRRQTYFVAGAVLGLAGILIAASALLVR